MLVIYDILKSENTFYRPSISRLGLLNFVDYISIYTGVCFLKDKADVFAFLQDFKSLAEKQSGKGINILRIDNGRDYSNKYVNNLYPFHLQFFM